MLWHKPNKGDYLFSDCGLLTDPEHGNVALTGQKYNDTAMYKCDIGYHVTTGDSNRICGNGSWEGVEPTCSIRGNIFNVSWVYIVYSTDLWVMFSDMFLNSMILNEYVNGHLWIEQV